MASGLDSARGGGGQSARRRRWTSKNRIDQWRAADIWADLRRGSLVEAIPGAAWGAA